MSASDTASPADRPAVKIRPGKGRRLAAGAPWVFADEIAMDRRTRALAPGAIVTLVRDGAAIATAAFNPESRIAVRLLDPDPAARIDTAWFAARLARAAALRNRLYDAPYWRWVHAEGDGLPGLVVDRFGDAVAVQPNAAWIDAALPALQEALGADVGTQVVQGSPRIRRLEGLTTGAPAVRGALAGPLEVPMNGAIYLADLTEGQKTGLYYDQRPNHAFAQRLAHGARVLDVFSHVGGFGLAALAGGAAEVLAIDSSAPALALAEDSARRAGWDGRYRVQQADAFDAMATLAGERFDMVVVDPPAFVPTKDALAQGLRAYERLARLAAPLVAEGGVLCLCSCSHAAGLEPFHKACVQGILKAGRHGALIRTGRAGPDHPVHVGLPEGGYLKALFFHLAG